MVGYGLQQLDGAEGGIGDGARVFRTEVRGLTEEHKGSIAHVPPRCPCHRRPETEQGAASRVVARSIFRPSAIHALPQAEAPPAEMSPLEEAEGDVGQEQRIGVPV